MITLVGVGHVFAISDKVKEAIRLRNPQVVCLELDVARFNSLMNRDKGRKAPPQYLVLASIQRRMAGKFGSEVGDEMLAAVSAAKEIGAKIALIDMEASMVFGRMWRAMSLKEKVGLFLGAFIGLVSSKEKVERELDAYEGDETKYLNTLGEEFPSVKKVLLDDRNDYMAKRITELAAMHQDVLAIVGDGHIPGLVSVLARQDVDIVRLKDLRSGSVAPADISTDHTVSYLLEQR